MANPQQQLYKMLAAGAAHRRDVDRIHGQVVQQLPQQQTGMTAQLEELRRHIQSVGIGSDPGAEDKYLQLLGQRRHLEQVSMLHPEVLTTVSTSGCQLSADGPAIQD